MRGLEAVVLIGAGRFSEVRLGVTDHVQVVGDTGNGKSTLCRALLFFYLGEPSRANYGLDASKQDWPTYYLSAPRSYVIFEVSRGDELPFHVAVTRPGHSIQFLFVDSQFRREDYLEETGLNAARIKPIDEVMESFDSLGIHYEKVDSYAGFQDRIYGTKTSPFNVFQPVPGKQDKLLVLGHAIAGMFRASVGGIDNMDLAKFRNVLVSTVTNPQEAEIDVREIANNIRDFTNDYQAISAYRKQEQNAELMLSILDDIDNARRECDSLMREFAARFMCVGLAIGEQNRLLGECKDKAALNRQAEEKLNAAHKEKVESIISVLGSVAGKIKAAETVIREFEEKDIKGKRNLLDTLPGIKGELAAIKSQVDFLQKEFSDEEARKNQALSIIDSEWNGIVALFNDRKNHISEAASAEQMAVSKEAERDLEKGRQDLDAALESLENGRKPLTQTIESVEQALREALSQPEPESLVAGRSRQAEEEKKKGLELRKKVQAEEQLRALKKDDELEMEKLHRKFEQQHCVLGDKRLAAEREVTSLSEQLAHLTARKAEVAQRLKALDESLAAFYRMSAPEGWEAAAKTIDHNLLFKSAESLSARIAEGNLTSAFGVDIDTEKLPSKQTIFDRSTLEAEEKETLKSLATCEVNLTQARQMLAEVEQQITYRLAEANQKEIQTREAQSVRREEKVKVLSAIDDAIQDCNQKLGLLEHQIEVARQEFTEKQTVVRTRLEGRKREAKTKIAEIEGQVTALRTAWKVKESAIKEGSEAKVAAIVREKEVRFVEIGSEHDIKRQAIESRRKGAQDDFLRRISDKGADTNQIESLTTQQKSLDTRVAEIEGFREEVARMEGRWSEHVVPLERLRQEHADLEGRKNAAETEHASRLSGLRKEAAEIAIEQKAIEERHKLLEQDAKAANEFEHEYPQHAGLLSSPDIEPSQPFISGTLEELLREIKKLKRSEAGWNEEGGQKFLRFRSGFAPEHIQLFGWGSLIETDWKIFVGAELRPFVRNNTVGARRNMLSQAFGILVNKMTSQLDRFQNSMGQVRQTTRKLGEFLDGEKLMDVIDFIHVKVEDKEGRLLARLRKVAELKNLHFGPEIRDLFSTPASQEHVEKAISAFANLSDEITHSKKDILALEECFDLQVRISENGVASAWETAIRTPGSHGTAYLVKMSIYLALLEIIRMGTFKNPAETRVHCLFDEAGTISPRHIDAILAYAERKGVTLIAAGQAQSSGAFSSWFQVWKSAESTETQFFGQLKAKKIKNVQWQ